MGPETTENDDTVPGGATDPQGGESVTAPSMPNRASALRRSAIVPVILLVVFGIILPQYVDYGQVKDALLALTPPEIALMTALGAVAWFVAGQLMVVLIPGLSPLRGNAAWLITAGVGSSIPFGPWNLGVIWVVLRGWGVRLEAATSGVAMYGIINTLARFALPLIAIVFVVVSGASDNHGDATLIISIISMAIFVVSVGVMLVVVKSKRAAEWLGIGLERVVVWILVRLGRSERPDVLGSIHGFQRGMGEVAHRRGLVGMAVALVAQGGWCVLFIVALRLTGVPPDVLTPADVVAAYALVGLITIIPVAGAGLPELVYIAELSAIAGQQWEPAITAGVVLFRLYAWFLPIPLAWILLRFVRHDRPMLPTAAELRSFAIAET